MINLYHFTNAGAAKAIGQEHRFISKESDSRVYFSDVLHGNAVGYGTHVVHIRVNKCYLEEEDEFQTGEMHYTAEADRFKFEFVNSFVYTSPTD